MSLKIRLSRGGAKKRPFYRIVVADARMPRDGRFVEKIGTFDPLKAKDDASRLVLDQEKAKAGSPRAPSRPTACCACSTGSASPSARRATIRKRPSRRRRRRSAPPRPKPPQPRPLKRPRPEPRMSRPATAPDRLILMGVFGAPQGVRGDVRVKSLTGDPEGDRRLRGADRRQTRARLRLRVVAIDQGRHAGRAGRRVYRRARRPRR